MHDGNLRGREKREKGGKKKIFKDIMAKIFPYMMKNINLNFQEVQQTPTVDKL